MHKIISLKGLLTKHHQGTGWLLKFLPPSNLVGDVQVLNIYSTNSSSNNRWQEDGIM
jgi:hypothetical protein